MAVVDKQCSVCRTLESGFWWFFGPSGLTGCLKSVGFHNVVLRNPLFMLSELYFFTCQARSSEIFGTRKGKIISGHGAVFESQSWGRSYRWQGDILGDGESPTWLSLVLKEKVEGLQGHICHLSFAVGWACSLARSHIHLPSLFHFFEKSQGY